MLAKRMGNAGLVHDVGILPGEIRNYNMRAEDEAENSLYDDAVLPNVVNPETAITCRYGSHPPPSAARGELLCQAFETYQAMIPSSQISFEHAVFLATTLTRGDLLRLAGCAECGGLVVTERFPIREKRCQQCTSTS